MYLHNLMEGVTKILKTPSDHFVLNDMYISAHSLKSQCQIMGYASTAKLCQMLERMFHDAKEDHIVLSQPILELVQKCLQQLRNSLTSIEEHNTENDLTDIIKELEDTSGIHLA